jgi:hypothetical protein
MTTFFNHHKNNLHFIYLIRLVFKYVIIKLICWKIPINVIKYQRDYEIACSYCRLILIYIKRACSANQSAYFHSIKNVYRG